MSIFSNEFILEALPKLLKVTNNRVEPVLGHLAKRGMPKNLATFAETNAQRLAVQGLTEGGVGRTDAMLRVYLERGIDKGLLPAAAAPKPGIFDLVKPNLPAKTTARIIGRPSAGILYNAKEGSTIANPAYMMEHMFGATHSPAIDAADAANTLVLNSHSYLKSLRPLVKGMKNPKNDKEFVADVTTGYRQAFPLMETVEKAWAERAALTKAGAPPRIQLTPVGGQPTPDPVAALTETINKGQQQIDAIYQPIMQKWFERSGSVRTMLAAEKLENPLAHPWLELGKLQPGELAASKAIRTMLNGIGERAGELGMPVVGKGYVPHFMGRIFDALNKSSPDIAARARGLMQQLPKDLRWQQRSIAGRQWWPAVQELQHYIPDAHRKLAFTPVIQKWAPVLKKIEAAGHGDVAAYTRKYLDELAHGDQLGRFDKITEMLVGAEYFGKVGFSPSTAFKHLWKATRLLAMHPISTIKTAPQLLNVVKGAMTRRYGMEPGAAYRLTSQMLYARALFHGFTGIDASRGVAGHMMGMLSSMPTAAVEAGERGLGILATIHKGMSRNLPFDTIQQQLYHTIMNVSFIGQVDRYAWLKTPLQRLFFLFYYTPMRITETTGKMGLYSVLPYRHLDQARQGFWTTLLKGQRRRDPYGTLYATHLARNIAIVGGAAGLAHAYTGISPTKLAQIAMAHLPMVRETPQGERIALPAVLEVPNQINEMGGLSMKSFAYALINHYAIYSPSKMIRLVQGDIPKMYKGGPLPDWAYYLAGEGPEDTLRAMQQQYEQKNAPRVKKRFDKLDKNEQRNIIMMFRNWMLGLVR